jgi:hypothetical protein
MRSYEKSAVSNWAADCGSRRDGHKLNQPTPAVEVEVLNTFIIPNFLYR